MKVKHDFGGNCFGELFWKFFKDAHGHLEILNLNILITNIGN